MNKNNPQTKKRLSKGGQVGGRPSLITRISKIDLSKVKHCTSKGYTDKELAIIFGVDDKTINNWKKEFPEFFLTLKAGKLLADAKVEASLYQRACGYSHPEVHITNYLGNVILTPIIKHYPPDPTSMIFWLKNRKPQEWRDKTEVEQIIKAHLYAENDGKSTKEIETESIRLAEAIMAKRQGIAIPETP